MFIYLVLSISVLCAYLLHLHYRYKYWEVRNVKGPTVLQLLKYISDVIRKKYGFREMIFKFYDSYPDEKYVGFYIGLQPTLVVKDLDLIKRIFVQDFSTFVDRGVKVTDGPLGRNLFDADGDEWRILRKTITPIFTSGKLKLMMPILNNCVKEYIQYLDEAVIENEVQEMKEVMLKYTTKTIISTAFGLDVNTFTKESHDFTIWADRIIGENVKIIVKMILDSYVPGISNKIIRRTDKEVTDFFLNFTKEIVKQREGKPKVRNDFMDLMIKIKEDGVLKNNIQGNTAELQITDELIAAQACIVYATGLDTSAGATSFLCYEMALNPDIQEKCYQEVKLVMEKNNCVLTFDSLKELPYLSMVYDETLRKYPIGPELLRSSVNKYTFPDTNVTIDKGIKLIIPVYSLHNDPKYFPSPEKFDPERFSPENKHKIQDFSYLPFGEGSRNCIGLRFARVQSLLGVGHFLYNYRIEENEKTPKKFRLDPTNLVLTHADGLWVTLKRR